MECHLPFTRGSGITRVGAGWGKGGPWMKGAQGHGSGFDGIRLRQCHGVVLRRFWVCPLLAAGFWTAGGIRVCSRRPGSFVSCRECIGRLCLRLVELERRVQDARRTQSKAFIQMFPLCFRNTLIITSSAVSYTHLDVYKRQAQVGADGRTGKHNRRLCPDRTTESDCYGTGNNG